MTITHPVVPPFTPLSEDEWRETYLTGDHPPLNYMMIETLIRWATADEKFYGEFKDWAQWDQTNWGRAVLSDAVLRKIGERVGDDDEAYVDDDRLKQSILNGACQTSYCMAGQAVTQYGYRMMFENEFESEGEQWSSNANYCIPQIKAGVDNKGRTIWVDDPEAAAQRISDTAARLLGLGPRESAEFFSGSNDIDRLKQLANGFCEVRDLPLMFPEWETEYV